MPEAVGTSDVHRDKRQAHQDGGHRQQLSEDHQVVQFLVFIDVDRNHQHDRRGSHADEEGEVGDIDAPGDLICHAGDVQALDELLGVRIEAEQADREQRASPQVVAPVPLQRHPGAPPQEGHVILDGSVHTSK